jgi:hypothetical protein
MMSSCLEILSTQSILFSVDSSIRSDQINLVETKEKSSEMESSMLHRFHIVDGRNLKTVIGKTLQHRLTHRTVILRRVFELRRRHRVRQAWQVSPSNRQGLGGSCASSESLDTGRSRDKSACRGGGGGSNCQKDKGLLNCNHIRKYLCMDLLMNRMLDADCLREKFDIKYVLERYALHLASLFDCATINACCFYSLTDTIFSCVFVVCTYVFGDGGYGAIFPFSNRYNVWVES